MEHTISNTNHRGGIVGIIQRSVFSVTAGWAVFSLLFALAGLFTFSASAGNWYVSQSVASSGNGQSWSTAWKQPSNIAWSSVQPGDTIWIAGGNYTGGLNIGKSGTAANYIYVKRVTSADAVATSAAGWSSAFDSQVVVSSSGPLKTAAAYVYIDGRMDMGMRFEVSNGGGLPTSADVTGGNYVTLTNLDLVGPNASPYPDGSSCGSSLATFNGDCSGVMIGYGYSPNPGADNITVTHCRVRGHPNEFWFAGARNITVEYCKIYDNGAANSATWHGNMMIVNGSDGITFRYNEVYNWQVEGLYPWGSVSRNWRVYGNLFHDGIGGKNGSTHRFLELRSYSGTVTHGPFYVYNNTIVNCWAGITRGDTTVYWTADSEVRNNLVYNVAGGSIGYLPSIASNNLTTSSDPFVSSSTRDYRIVATVSASMPKNAGTSIANSGTHTYDRDMLGFTRGGDGAWDIGAYEQGGMVTVSTNPIIALTSTILSFGSLPVGTTTNLTMTVRNAGAGTLSGSATASLPFSIVSGGTYSLGSNQSQVVTFRYAPTSAGSHSQSVSFSGGGGATLSLSGSSWAPLSGNSFAAIAGTITSPFVVNAGGYISQASETTLAASGRAVYGFTVTNAGSYLITAMVNAPDASANSLFLNVDAEPADPTGIWDVPATSGFESRTVAWRGTGTDTVSQFNPKTFTLAAGTHQLIVRGREANVQVSQFAIVKIPEAPSNLVAIPAQ